MDDPVEIPPQKIAEYLFENDPFSQWLGIEIIDVQKGSCLLRCMLTEKHLNGARVTHGGVLFSLADTAIAYTAASYGRLALTIDNSISFIKSTYPGDALTIRTEVLSMGNKTGVVQVEIKNENDQLIAAIRGTVYRTNEMFDL